MVKKVYQQLITIVRPGKNDGMVSRPRSESRRLESATILEYVKECFTLAAQNVVLFIKPYLSKGLSRFPVADLILSSNSKRPDLERGLRSRSDQQTYLI